VLGRYGLVAKKDEPRFEVPEITESQFFSFASKEENVELFSKAFSSSYAIP
jgi:hypothetical protein